MKDSNQYIGKFIRDYLAEVERTNIAIVNIQEVARDLSISIFMALTYSKDESQGHAHLECEYLGNGDRWDKPYYCQQIGSRMLLFD